MSTSVKPVKIKCNGWLHDLGRDIFSFIHIACILQQTAIIIENYLQWLSIMS
jgi:hypothetical protein